MAIKLHKWTGTITSPDSYDSSIPSPNWYGSDGTTSFALLDEDFAKLCKSSEDDLAVTTTTAHKNWVKSSSPHSKIIRKNCQEAIRKEYGIEDELEALRTDDSTVKTAIAKIVAVYTTKLSALVGD